MVAPGVKLDTHLSQHRPLFSRGAHREAHLDRPLNVAEATNQRGAERRAVAFPARLTWKDQRGPTRFASVVARNVSDHGVYVECHSIVSIPLYRLVQFQLEREVRESDALPGDAPAGPGALGGLPGVGADAGGPAARARAAPDGGSRTATRRPRASNRRATA